MCKQLYLCVCVYLSSAHKVLYVHFKRRLKVHRFLRVCLCVTWVCVCVCMCTVCGDKPLHCRHSSSLKHPLVSHMLPSLLRAWPGSAASTKYGVVDTCALRGLLTSQLVVPDLSSHHGTECAQIHVWLCVYVCRTVQLRECTSWFMCLFSLSFYRDVFWKILSRAQTIFVGG